VWLFAAIADLAVSRCFNMNPTAQNAGTAFNDLPQIVRYTTTHCHETGKTSFITSLPEHPEPQLLGLTAFTTLYTTASFPPALDDDELASATASPRVPPNGTSMVFIDLPPGSTSPMHRTVSLDFGVLLQGEIELVLDSGDSRTLKKGDVFVQRGTQHSWQNKSGKDWVRFLAVLQPIEKLCVNGEEFEEESTPFEEWKKAKGNEGEPRA